MAIKYAEDIETQAVGSGQALAVIAPEPIIIPAARPSAALVPKLIADAGEHASLRFLDFFTANIRNPNTRAAYAVAVRAFFAWLDSKKVATLAAARTHHVSAYVEVLGRRYRAPTVKQHLAAIRMLFDWLIVGQIFAGPNPAAAVRGPKHVVKKGKTPVLDGDEAKKLLDSIDVSTIVGLRDRALIALLVYTFARVSAALHMNVEDYYPQENAGGCGCTRRAASSTKCRRITSSNIYWTPTSARCAPKPAGNSTRRRRSSERSVGAGATTDAGADGATGCAANDRAARTRGWHYHEARMPHVSRDRDHRLPFERRAVGIRAADGGARERAHHQALRPAQRSGDPGSGRADRVVKSRSWRHSDTDRTQLCILGLHFIPSGSNVGNLR
jgi:hypothetical protein